VTKASLPIATPAQTGVPALIHTFRSIVTGAGTPPSEGTARIRTVAEICVTDPILTGGLVLNHAAQAQKTGLFEMDVGSHIGLKGGLDTSAHAGTEHLLQKNGPPGCVRCAVALYSSSIAATLPCGALRSASPPPALQRADSIT